MTDYGSVTLSYTEALIEAKPLLNTTPPSQFESNESLIKERITLKDLL